MKAMIQRQPWAHFFALACCAFALAIVVGCATRPQNATDYVKTAEAQVGGIYRSIGDLAAQKLITEDQGKTYFKRNQVFEAQVNDARKAIGRGDSVSAQQIAAAALAGLTELSAELNQRK